MPMKLFNTIVTYDVYCLAESEEAARATIRQAIRTATENPEAEGPTYEAPSEEVAIEARDKKHVREKWVGMKPFVADDVSDDDFERVRGKTTIEVFEMLHVKKPEPSVNPDTTAAAPAKKAKTK